VKQHPKTDQVVRDVRAVLLSHASEYEMAEILLVLPTYVDECLVQESYEADEDPVVIARGFLQDCVIDLGAHTGIFDSDVELAEQVMKRL
jgi:hypothetical protein